MDDSKQNIQVSLRVRPLQANERPSAMELLPETQEVRLNNKTFSFDRVFNPDTSQEEVYSTIVRPLVDQLVLGFNCSILAYGPTGTGKTYTIEGERESLDSPEPQSCIKAGMIPRAVSQLFDIISRSDKHFIVRVSFLELYNEEAYDLLSQRPIEELVKLRIFDDKGSVIVSGLEEVVINSESDIYELLARGSSRRRTASTQCNAWSSRSHSIFTLTVNSSGTGSELFTTGKLNLVDLAGSENIARSGAQDKRAREAANINQSLLALGRVICALVEKHPHIPYRESKLTRILQDSLGGRTKTSIIAAISPAISDVEDTLSTLEHAARAKKITNRPEMNKCYPRKTLQLDYEDEIEMLIRKHQIEMNTLEFRIRDEVAEDYKLFCDKYKDNFNKQKSEIQEAHEAVIRKLKLEHEETLTALEGTQSELDSVKEKLAESQSELAKANLELASSKELMENSISVKLTEIDNLQAELAGVKSLSEEYRKQVADTNAELQSVRATLKESESELVAARFRNDMVTRLRAEGEAKLEAALAEIKSLTELNAKLQNPEKPQKVRKIAPADECGDYANMTFDDADELTHVPASKQARAKRKRIIRADLVLSGKKKKLSHNQRDAELSPILTEGRVTRSKRRLEF